MESAQINSLKALTLAIAKSLRGPFRPSEYGQVVLPFMVLRRLDCVLLATKQQVLDAVSNLPEGIDDETRDMILFEAAGGNIHVYNTSRLTFAAMKSQDSRHIHENLLDYITKFSPNVRDIFLERFKFAEPLKKLRDKEKLWFVFDKFCDIDLHPDAISNIEMGYLFEDLIRQFSELSNETAGEHFTPREVIRLIVDVLIAQDDQRLAGRGIIRQVYDPACGTGGMLVLAEEALKHFNPDIRVELFGQEWNDESFAICRSDMMMTGHDPEHIAAGNTLTADAHKGRRFHYMLSNPPYGVDWKDYQESIKTEFAELGFRGRFGPGLPRVSDGQLLFLLHMISKMREDEIGSRIGIVTNGSPLFTGNAGSGESEIRRWMLESDMVQAIIALPTDIFYNTGIQTFIWILSNRKVPKRRSKVQLINASSEQFWRTLRQSLGSKRRTIPKEARDEIVRIYAEMYDCVDGSSNYSRVIDRTEFGYREIRIERPLRLNFQAAPDRIRKLESVCSLNSVKVSKAQKKSFIENLTFRLSQLSQSNQTAFEKAIIEAANWSEIKLDSSTRTTILMLLSEPDDKADAFLNNKGKPVADISKREFQKIPLSADWRQFAINDVTPFVPDAWIDEAYCDHTDHNVGRVGYEINFNRYFYEYYRPQPIVEIDNALKEMQKQFALILDKVLSK